LDLIAAGLVVDDLDLNGSLAMLAHRPTAINPDAGRLQNKWGASRRGLADISRARNDRDQRMQPGAALSHRYRLLRLTDRAQ
jgi:hypothetical protein